MHREKTSRVCIMRKRESKPKETSLNFVEINQLVNDSVFKYFVGEPKENKKVTFPTSIIKPKK